MAVPVTVPRLGLDTNAALVAEWYQPDGATVLKGDPVYRLELDFVAIEVEAEEEGILRHQAEAGVAFPAGEVVAYILAPGERMPGETGTQREPESESSAPLPDEAAETQADGPERPAGAYPLADVLAAGAQAGPPESEQGLPEGLPWDAFPGASSDSGGGEAFEPPEPVLLFPRIVNALKAEAQVSIEEESDEVVETPEAEPEPEADTRMGRVSAWDLVPGEADFNPEWIMERAEVADGLSPAPDPARADRFQASNIRSLALGLESEDQETDAPSQAEPALAQEEASATVISPRLARLAPEEPDAWSRDETAPGPELAQEEELPPAVVAPLARLASHEPHGERRRAPVPGPALSMRVSVDMGEAAKMRDQLTREWWGSNIRPTDEDIVLRAIARALLDSSAFRRRTDAVGMRFLTGLSRGVHLLPDAATRPFRDAVASLAALRETPGAEIPCVCTLTPLTDFDLDEAVPALPDAQPLAFAMGAVRDVARFRGEHAYRSREMILTLAYDSAAMPEAAAARLLGRVRELVEAPYALLAH